MFQFYIVVFASYLNIICVTKLIFFTDLITCFLLYYPKINAKQQLNLLLERHSCLLPNSSWIYNFQIISERNYIYYKECLLTMKTLSLSITPASTSGSQFYMNIFNVLNPYFLHVTSNMRYMWLKHTFRKLYQRTPMYRNIIFFRNFRKFNYFIKVVDSSLE